MCHVLLHYHEYYLMWSIRRVHSLRTPFLYSNRFKYLNGFGVIFSIIRRDFNTGFLICCIFLFELCEYLIEFFIRIYQIGAQVQMFCLVRGGIWNQKTITIQNVEDTSKWHSQKESISGFLRKSALRSGILHIQHESNKICMVKGKTQRLPLSWQETPGE